MQSVFNNITQNKNVKKQQRNTLKFGASTGQMSRSKNTIKG